jgi:hypothetical protein
MSGGDARPASGSVGVKPQLVRNFPSTLRGWYLFNPNGVQVYLQFHDKADAGDLTLGTSLPFFSLGIPPGSGANALQDRVADFLNGIVIACTTTRAGNVAPAVPLDFNLFFC